MLRTQKIGYIYSAVSLIAAYYFTNGIFETVCRTKRSKSDIANEKLELLLDSRRIDSHPVSRGHLRQTFSYSLWPWKVLSRLKDDEFSCPRTTKSDPIKMVVFIKSAARYYDRRRSVRQTWGRVSHLENMVIHHVFIVGMTTKDVQKEIEIENARHGDILQYIGVDDYRYIAYKVLAGMQWAKDYLSRDYFYATSDDDLLVNITDLPRQIRLRLRTVKSKLPSNTRKTHQAILSRMPILCILSYRETEEPVRDVLSKFGKYYMDPREYPMAYFPPFCLGGFYMMPIESAGKLYDVSRHEKALAMDDVWITGLLRLQVAGLTVDAIDSSAELRKSQYVQHLGGDIDGNTIDISSTVIDQWQEMYDSIKLKRHCLVDRLEV